MSTVFDPQNRNYAYYKLVKEKNDFVGMIAYSIYKGKKVEYIKEIRKDGSKSESEIDNLLKTWQAAECSDKNVENYRASATNILSLFTNDLVKSKDEELIKQEAELKKQTTALEKEKNKFEKKKNKLKDKNAFWSNVWAGVLASFIFLIISVVIYLILDKGFNLSDYIISKLNS